MDKLIPVVSAVEPVLLAIDRADLAESTGEQYRKALIAYRDTGASRTDLETLAAYAPASASLIWI